MFVFTISPLRKYELICKNNNRKIAVCTDALIAGTKKAIFFHQPQSVLEYGKPQYSY